MSYWWCHSVVCHCHIGDCATAMTSSAVFALRFLLLHWGLHIMRKRPFHLSSAGLEKADSTREPRSQKRLERTCDTGAPIVRCLFPWIQQANAPALLPTLTLQLLRPFRVAAVASYSGDPWAPQQRVWKRQEVIKVHRQSFQTALRKIRNVLV